MKTIIALVFLTLVFLVNTVDCNAYVRVRSYFRKSGSYVPSYHRTNSNSYKWDNWSAKGNVNPFTGRKGYKNW